MPLPQSVKIVEVGPRDGLQNEPKALTTQIKLELIHLLAKAGLKNIEVTSFVSPKWVPQMADHSELSKQLVQQPDINYPALIPNMQGYFSARKAGINSIAVFTAASEQFSKKNTNTTIKQSLEQISLICDQAQKDKVPVRGYISCVLGCPYKGKMSKEQVAVIAKELINMGCYEISLGDTTGQGTPLKAKALIEHVCKHIPINQLAMHYHDTYGQALANILISLQCGIHIFDTSIAGLGGCPYAPGASGNVATEDVYYMLNGMDIETGIDREQLLKAGAFITKHIGRKSRSKAALAQRHHAEPEHS